MVNTCKTCEGRILSHNFIIQCSVCSFKYHSKCLPLVDKNEFQHLKSDANWICVNCTSSLFPYNHFDDQQDFINAVSENWFINNLYTLEDLNQRLFSPFEIDQEQHNIMNDDYDPDLNFFRDLNITSSSSVYFCEEKFKSYINTNKLNSFNPLSFIHLNIRSIPKNIDSLTSYLESLNFLFNFIGLSETWFNDVTSPLYGIDGYSHEKVFRSNRRGGGVSLFIKENIVYSVRSDLNNFESDAETIFIEVDKSVFQTQSNLVVGLIYRIPDRDVTQFNYNFNEVLNIIKTENKTCYLLGDYNINLLNSETHTPTSDFLDICFSNNFVPLINKPTRVTKHSATIIDNILTNNIVNVSYVQGLFLTDISDHFPIFVIDKNVKQDTVELKQKRRIINIKNMTKFKDLIQEDTFQNIFEIDDANNAASEFQNVLGILYDKCFPLKIINTKYCCKKPWLSEGLKSSIKKKNMLYKCFIKNPTLQSEKLYKTYRNKLHHLLKIAEREHFHTIISTNQGNLKKTWSIMKDIINKKKVKNKPNYFMSNSKKITDSTEIATGFNNFFANIGESLADKIPPSNCSALSYLKENYTKSIFLNPISQQELILIFKQLKGNSSSGWDDISAKVLQHSHLVLLDPVLHLLNLSLSQGIFPDVLKIAKVIPLFKGGDAFLFTNYRPISILSSLSKIFERVFYNRLFDFLRQEDILYDKQFGFRKSYSTQMALLLLTDRITNAIEHGEFCMGVFLDFSKAFDTVNHSILLQKLNYYGIRGVANDWVRSYLHNRSQHVIYDEKRSSTINISCGVPQGSILGPLLFLIYINDLSKISNSLYMIMYADDTNVFISGKNLKDLEIVMNRELAFLSEWLRANKLSLNVSKTHYMIFSPSKIKHNQNIKLKIIDEEIHSVNQTKFLGVILDSHLTWKPHVKYISSKVSKSVGIISKARKYLNQKSLQCLYYSFVYPYFLYCTPIWGGAKKCTLDKLIKTQKRAIRTISNKPKRTPSLPLFKSLQILTLNQIYEVQVLLFVYKYKLCLLPAIFNDFFTSTCDIHAHNTRQNLNYYPPRCRTDYAKQSVKYVGSKFWNVLPNEIKDSKRSVSVFKKHIIKNLLM